MRVLVLTIFFIIFVFGLAPVMDAGNEVDFKVNQTINETSTVSWTQNWLNQSSDNSNVAEEDGSLVLDDNASKGYWVSEVVNRSDQHDTVELSWIVSNNDSSVNLTVEGSDSYSFSGVNKSVTFENVTGADSNSSSFDSYSYYRVQANLSDDGSDSSGYPEVAELDLVFQESNVSQESGMGSGIAKPFTVALFLVGGFLLLVRISS
jgi:hypothetical protein